MRRGLCLLGLAAFAAGCTTAPSLPPIENPTATWQLRQAQLRPISAWNIQGRLALRMAEEGWQASVLWVREGDRQQIDLTGPLGRGHLRLTQDKDGAELRDADQRTWRADNAQQLLYRTTGWLVPLDGLNYWILGLPTPQVSASEELDDQGRLKVLVQSGWDIQFLEYARYGLLDLPSKIFIKRKNAATRERNLPDATLEVKLVVERWTLDERER